MSNKVILLYPDNWKYDKWQWLPTNLIFLASTLKERGYCPVIVDAHILTEQETLAQIEHHLDDACIVLISTVTGRQLYNSRRLARHIKNIKNIPICVGGPHPTAVPELTATDLCFDYVIAGQGEFAVCDLCDVVTGKVNDKAEIALDSIPNLYRRLPSGQIRISPTPPKKINIEELPPLPYFDKDIINVADYLNPDTLAINYATSVGCVGRCSFCFWHEDYRYSFFSPERVIADLKRFKTEYGIRNIEFDDPTFFVSPLRSVQIAKMILNEGLDLKWRGNARINTLRQLNEDDFRVIKNSGCHLIHIGLESGSERMLKLMNKEITADDARMLIEMSLITGIKFRFHILIGLPSETIEDLKETATLINRMLEIFPDFDYTLNVFTPFPGNMLTKFAEQFGYRAPSTLEEYENLNMLNWKYLPEQEDVLVTDLSFWKEDVEIPWFTPEFTKEYFKVFRELFPEKRTMETTDGKIVELF